MANDKPTTFKMNTPLGTAKWPKLTAPDYGTAEHPKPEGEYSVKLVWNESDPAFQKFRAKMEGYLAEAEEAGREQFAALKKPQRDKLGGMKMNPLFTPIYDDNEEPTGQVEMKLTMKASGVVKRGPREGKKWDRKPDLYDAFGRKITKPIEIWGGSELIVSFSFIQGGYFIAGSGLTGLKCSLEGVQVVTLRQGGERSAESHGFSAQAGGFSADELPSNSDADADDEFAGGGSDMGSASDAAGEPEGTADF
jgi:hypothetical protein